MAKLKLPKDLGALIDLGRQLEQERLEYEREVKEKVAVMAERERQVEDALIAYCEDHKVGKISGTAATATFHKTAIPNVQDWDAFYEHIKTTGEFDLLEKRPGKLAYRARLEDGKRVPGVVTFWKKSISYSKFGGKA